MLFKAVIAYVCRPFLYVYVWFLISKLSHEYRIPMPKIRLGLFDVSGRHANGCYSERTNTIQMDVVNCICHRSIKRTALHEFRHAWQFFKFREIFLWWRKDISLYKQYYATPLNLIEEDARTFARSSGLKNGDGIVTLFSVGELERRKNDGSFSELVAKAMILRERNL